jgi:phosphopantothenoylcysteine decarboxylase/phosphopantothenate--cysteine ligase
METRMWEHPATQENITTLKSRGVHVLEPDSGRLASGAAGTGRLPEREVIIEQTARVLGSGELLSGKTVLITAGPTREMLDPVRFISNPASGKMGFALARAAVRQGAKNVHLVTGPVTLRTPLGVERHDIAGAEQMLKAAQSIAAKADLVLASAAVGDFAAGKIAANKIKKKDGKLKLEFERTPDILAWLSSHRRKGAKVVGFAVETEKETEHARSKLEAKGLDMIVLNNPTQPGAGFETETNKVTVLGPKGFQQDFPLQSKEELADRLIELAMGKGKGSKVKGIEI